jgi:hypothetical protein
MLKFLATKRFWKRFALTVGAVVLLLVLVCGSFAWWVNHQWASRVAAIRATGTPASLAELAPERVPDDQNAAAILGSVQPRLDEFSKDYAHFYNSPLGEAYSDARDKCEPPTADEIAVIREIVNKYPDIDAALAKAATCDQYASQTDFSLPAPVFLEEVTGEGGRRFRTVARFANWRMQVQIADGQAEQAVQVGLETLRLARLHDAEPCLANYLVGVAVRGIAAEPLCDALALGGVSPEVHAALDAELAKQDDPERFQKVLITERAFVASNIVDMSKCNSEVCKRGAPYVSNVVMEWYGVGVLDAMNEHITTADQPWYKLYGDRKSTDTKSTGHGVLADLLLPAIQAAHDANARITATLRALRIFNALTEYRDQHGREATGLADLSLPKEATIDPFSGEPLKLKHTDEGWVVYSVFTNGVDDGGNFKDMKDCGVAPRKLRATR